MSMFGSSSRIQINGGTFNVIGGPSAPIFGDGSRLEISGGTFNIFQLAGDLPMTLEDSERIIGREQLRLPYDSEQSDSDHDYSPLPADIGDASRLGISGGTFNTFQLAGDLPMTLEDSERIIGNRLTGEQLRLAYDSEPSVSDHDNLPLPADIGHDSHGNVNLRELQGEPGATSREICAMIERLNKLFHDDKEWYAKFLACRGASAQQLLDLLQDLLDYDSNLATMTRRRLFKGLIRLSGDSKLHPQCFTLTGLKNGSLVAGGSFGDVFKGFLYGQTVAIKMMRVFKESDIDALLKEFGREALIWRQLCHPNLLPFFGLYYFQKRLCLVSPWMENGHMREFLQKESYDTDCLLSLILDVALGLEHLHDKGVVHGDLKGDNIFITPSHRACIADFGLSSIITPISSLRFTNSSKRTQGGTIRYQAPELHQGRHNDLRSDIYAFACVVYELLTGKPPFPELYMDGMVIHAVLEGRRPPRPASCSGTPVLNGLWNLLQNCWKEQPEMRPTAAQIVEQLMDPDIQAKKTQFTTDWDDRFTSRFRRRLMGQRPLPSALEFERMIFGDGVGEGKSLVEPKPEIDASGLASRLPKTKNLHLEQEESNRTLKHRFEDEPPQWDTEGDPELEVPTRKKGKARAPGAPAAVSPKKKRPQKASTSVETPALVSRNTRSKTKAVKAATGA
ncbi:kinase-like domain-containing protein [Mycena vulgaris]|nr:kinase-like domain-containing protein [Mycena vulgaris]